MQDCGWRNKNGAEVDAVKSFSEAETNKLEIAFDHGKTVEDAFFLLKNKCSAMKSVL